MNVREQCARRLPLGLCVVFISQLTPGGPIIVSSNTHQPPGRQFRFQQHVHPTDVIECVERWLAELPPNLGTWDQGARDNVGAAWSDLRGRLARVPMAEGAIS